LETDPIIAAGALLTEGLYGKIIPIVLRPEIDPADVIRHHSRVNAYTGLIEVLSHGRQTAHITANDT
jgi:hypothetical protein